MLRRRARPGDISNSAYAARLSTATYELRIASAAMARSFPAPKLTGGRETMMRMSMLVALGGALLTGCGAEVRARLSAARRQPRTRARGVPGAALHGVPPRRGPRRAEPGGRHGQRHARRRDGASEELRRARHGDYQSVASTRSRISAEPGRDSRRPVADEPRVPERRDDGAAADRPGRVPAGSYQLVPPPILPYTYIYP